MASKDEPADPLMVFAEALRSKGGVECRSGVLNGERVELFRGKDLVRWVKANPAKCAAAAGGKGGEVEELGRALGQQLVRHRLALHVDRLNKKPLPNSKKLVKFPRKLTLLPPDQAAVFVEEGFYIWLYERPTSAWTYVWTALIPVAVLGACLFPLAPNWAKLGVFYASSGLLMAILALLLLRSVLAVSTLLASGRTLWLLPNLMSEELPITQVLRPLVSVQHPGEGASKWNNHPLTRLAVAAALAGLLSVLYRHSPDKASMATEASRYKDDVMDWLGLQRDSQHRLTMGNDTAAPANVTDATAGAAPAAEAEAPADGVAAGEEAAAAEEAADEAAVGDAEGIEEEAELRVALHSS